MSLNKDQVSTIFLLVFHFQSKKQGVFINFRDHKGKLEKAVEKMLGDLKKFGLPNRKNFKIHDLLKGYGEQVCQLVDELVNLELYRRDFEFMQPVIPPDEDEEDMFEE